MRTSAYLLVLIGAMLLVPVLATGCNKTAEDTNKPVIISSFDFTVDGESSTPTGTLQIEPGTILTVKVIYTDPDAGDEPDPAWYSFTWSVERIGTGTSLFNPNEYFIVSDENPCIWATPDVTGFFRFRVEVRDKYQTPSMETVVVEVNSNKQPKINSILVSDGNPFVNQQVTITVEATDPDGNLPLEYTWQANGGYFVSESDDQAVWLSPTAGAFTITVVVEDQAGGSVSRDVPINVQQNHDPVISGWDIDPDDTVAVNGVVTITLDVDDIDDDTLEYNWSADKGTFNSVNQNVAVWRAPGAAASCTITCVVEDGKGGSDTAQIIISVE
jgi:hypothetical protein